MSKNDVPQFTKIRTADLSAMTDLLTDSCMAFEDIINDLTNGTPAEAKGRARGMAIELRNWRPNPKDSEE